MIKQIEVEQIKNLIKEGFDLKLISFQLEIPIELLIKYSREIEEERAPEESDRKTYLEEARNNTIKDKIKLMRQKYNTLYYRSDSTLTYKAEEITEETRELIIQSVKNVEEMFDEIIPLDRNAKDERRKRIQNSRKIISEIRKIKDLPLTIEQAESMYKVLNSGELQQEEEEVNSIEKKLYVLKKAMAKRIIEGVERLSYETEDIENLRNLQKRLTKKIKAENSIAAQTVHSKIERRITEKRQKEAIEKIKNDIPQSFEPILYGLAKGTLDIRQAQIIIEEEIKKREANRSNGKFAIKTEEQRKQIFMKLYSTLGGKANQFSIENPEQTIQLIQELSGETIENALRTVAKNLLGANRHSEAIGICEKIYEQYKRDSNASAIKMIRDEARYQEIGYYILRGIKRDVTENEDILYFKKIEEGLKTSNINLKAIPLGQSSDGVRKISLADIWIDEIKGERIEPTMDTP